MDKKLRIFGDPKEIEAARSIDYYKTKNKKKKRTSPPKNQSYNNMFNHLKHNNK